MIFGSPVRKPLHEGSWKRPSGNVDFRVTQPFGCTGYAAEPRLGDCAHFHRGLDMGDGRCGSNVVAAADGRVVRSRRLGNGEQSVVLRHGDFWTLYGHLRTRAVAEGAVVAKGQLVGEVGDTGNAQGCHLHFGVKRGGSLSGIYGDEGEWLDPWPRLEQNANGIDPDAPVEDDVYPLIDPRLGHSASIGANSNIRPVPSTKSEPRYSKNGETWPEVIGYVKGELVVGSDQWLERWNGTAYEYAHISTVTSVTAPFVDCSAQEQQIAALQAQIEAAKVPATATVTALGG